VGKQHEPAHTVFVIVMFMHHTCSTDTNCQQQRKHSPPPFAFKKALPNKRKISNTICLKGSAKQEKITTWCAFTKAHARQKQHA
jgi:hypothetical protein